MPKANFLLVLLLIFSCSKKTAEKTSVISENTAIPPYDTVAIDSFSDAPPPGPVTPGLYWISPESAWASSGKQQANASRASTDESKREERPELRVA